MLDKLILKLLPRTIHELYHYQYRRPENWKKHLARTAYRKYVNEIFLPPHTRVTRLGHGVELNKKYNEYGEWVELWDGKKDNKKYTVHIAIHE